MERKLIKQGGGGCTIYLPKKWLDKKKLKSGDLIKITETENSLIIGGELKGRDKVEIEIHKDNEHDLKHILTHAYRMGFNKIILKMNDASLRKKATKLANLLLGFEVTEIDNSGIVIENISEPSEDKYESILGKVFLVIKETQAFVRTALENEKYKDSDEMEELRTQADKFIIFCRRLLMKEKYEKNIALEWEMLTFLMHIQHSYYYLYKYLADNKIKSDKKVLEYLKELEEYFKLYEKAHHNKDIKTVHQINKLREKYHFGAFIKEIEKANSKNSVVYSYLKEISRLIQIGTSPILSMSIHL